MMKLKKNTQLKKNPAKKNLVYPQKTSQTRDPNQEIWITSRKANQN